MKIGRKNNSEFIREDNIEHSSQHTIITPSTQQPETIEVEKPNTQQTILSTYTSLVKEDLDQQKSERSCHT